MAEKEKTDQTNLANLTDDSFSISYPLLLLPASASEAGTAEITSLPVFPIASKN